MLRPILCACLLVFDVLLIQLRVPAKDYYVATNGTAAGQGTIVQPIDLATALSGRAGSPGDTFWLMSGTYTIGHINTTIQGVPGAPITFRELPGQQARINGSVTFWNSSGNVVVRDFEWFSSDTNRFSSETNVGFNPTDIAIIPGIASYVPNMSFINLVVHDETRHGFYISQTGSNDLVYGCVIYNNGWRSPDNAEGHGIYVQGADGNREVVDNLVFNNSGTSLHIYENDTNYYLAGITLDGNVAFNAGTLQNIRFYRDMLVGVDAPAISADRIVFKNNFGFLPPKDLGDDAAQIGREGINGGVAILNNYLPEGLEINNWTIAAMSGNTVGPQTTNYVLGSAVGGQTTNYVLGLDQTLANLSAAWDNNYYWVPSNNGGFMWDSYVLNFAGWQNATGYDANSTCNIGNLSSPRIFIETNRYEAGRANIVVYNWADETNVAVDVSSALVAGMPYEVRNAEDFFAPPVLSGVYTNQLLDLPMTGLTSAVPNGPMLTPLPTGPIFNVFVLLPRYVWLQAQKNNGMVFITWPTNSGDWILQSAASLPGGDAWTDDTNVPTLEGDHELVTNSIYGIPRFYRLRPAP